MSNYRRLFILILALSLLPLNVYASAFSGPDPNFPCGSHRCACTSRKKCAAHCCCFPRKTKTPAAQDQAAIRSCASMEESHLPAERHELFVETFPTPHYQPQERFIVRSTLLYASIVYDISLPPPKASC